MSRKTKTPTAVKAKNRLQWRPANALNAGAASRAAWSKSGAKGKKNPRGRKPKRQA